MFRLALLVAVLRKAVQANIRDEGTLIVYYWESDTLDAVRESQTRDYDWSQSVGAWSRLGCLGAENLDEIDGLDDTELSRLVKDFRCFLPDVTLVVE